MGVEYSILENKPKITLKNQDGEDTLCLDLLAQSFRGDNIEDLNFEPVLVTKDYIARPDLISLAKYGDDKYADIICKLNGISNPFELNEGTILFVPEPEYVYLATQTTDIDNSASELVDENMDTIGIKTSTKQKNKKEDRSPNQQTVGESNYYIDTANGLVFY